MIDAIVEIARFIRVIIQRARCPFKRLNVIRHEAGRRVDRHEDCPPDLGR
jgi:hypothetical protein